MPVSATDIEDPIRVDKHAERHKTGGPDAIVQSLAEVTSAQTLTQSNDVVLVDASGGNVKLLLPTAASHIQKVYTVKKTDSSDNSVTIDPDGVETIDGETSLSLTVQYKYVSIISDGDEWLIIGGEYMNLEELAMESNETQGNILKLLMLFKKALKKMSNLDLEED